MFLIFYMVIHVRTLVVQQVYVGLRTPYRMYAPKLPHVTMRQQKLFRRPSLCSAVVHERMWVGGLVVYVSAGRGGGTMEPFISLEVEWLHHSSPPSPPRYPIQPINAENYSLS
jgi:hypothetical protein